MYLNGNEYSKAYSIITFKGVPFTFDTLDWELDKVKIQNKGNYNKVLSVTYGAEEIKSITISMKQSQMRKVAKAATSQKLTDVAPGELKILALTGAADKGCLYVFSDFEFKNEKASFGSADDPTVTGEVMCIASDIQIIEGGA
jgi:hypothetical protein